MHPNAYASSVMVQLLFTPPYTAMLCSRAEQLIDLIDNHDY